MSLHSSSEARVASHTTKSVSAAHSDMVTWPGAGEARPAVPLPHLSTGQLGPHQGQDSQQQQLHLIQGHKEVPRSTGAKIVLCSVVCIRYSLTFMAAKTVFLYPEPNPAY